MNITKFGHACLLLDNDQQKLLLDPGTFSTLPNELSGITTVVVSEEHIDHFNVDNLKKVVAQNPAVKIFSTKAVADKLSEESIACQAIEGAQTIQAEGFKLVLSEGDHAPTYQVSPCRVITVQVDDFLYYPSDSYITTNAAVKVLALPTSGPWHKIEEAIDFAKAITSEFVLPTHNGLYNDTGNDVSNHFIESNLDLSNRTYVYLKDGENRDF